MWVQYGIYIGRVLRGDLGKSIVTQEPVIREFLALFPATIELALCAILFALLLGIGVFLFAMWWDASDPVRQTRRSDVAFWLHLLAAPLIVHPIFSLLGLTDGSASTGEAVIVLLVYVALGLTAVAAHFVPV